MTKMCYNLVASNLQARGDFAKNLQGDLLHSPSVHNLIAMFKLITFVSIYSVQI